MIRRIIAAAGQVGGVLVNAARARSDRLVELEAELRGARAWCDRLAKVAQTANRQAMDASRERDDARAWAGRWKRLARWHRDNWKTFDPILAAAKQEASRWHDEATACAGQRDDAQRALTLAVQVTEAERALRFAERRLHVDPYVAGSRTAEAHARARLRSLGHDPDPVTPEERLAACGRAEA